MREEERLAFYCIRCESDREDALDVWKPILQRPQDPSNHALRARAISAQFSAQVSVYLYGRPVGRDYAVFGEGSLPLRVNTAIVRQFAENWK